MLESSFTKHFPFELDHELGRRGMEREGGSGHLRQREATACSFSKAQR